MMAKPYQPANGTEGFAFMEHFCDRCVNQPDSDDESGCEILGRTMAHNVGDPEYPKEWITDDDGPRCTAFEQRVEPCDVVQAAIVAPKPLKPLPNQQELF